MFRRMTGQPFPSPSSQSGGRSGVFSKLDDESCARLAQEGDRAALAELVHRHTAGVYHLFARLFSDRETASDGTQEVFLRAHHHLDSFNTDRSFRKWLYAIAWNFARDQFRRESRRRNARILSLDDFRRAGKQDGPAVEPADKRAVLPEDSLEAKERAVWVRKALDRLPPAQRAVLVLREFEGFSYEEIAALVGCKVGTIKSRLNRARLELKDTLLALRPGGLEELTFRGS